VDPSPAPWRVLEDPVVTPPGGDTSVKPDSASSHAIPRWAIVSGLVAALLTIGAFFLAAGSSSGSVAVQGGVPLGVAASGAASRSDAATISSTARILVVEIVGAVDHPGVFRLPAGSRVGDLVDAAGGYGPRVDTGRAARELNLAALLADGDQVHVPSRDDQAGSGPTDGPTSGSTAPHAPIDLNRATAAELDTLPGIGPATAAKIIASREEQPFASVDDLRTRKLVGEKTFEKLKDLVAAG
jgi:competence protein ComEA